MAYIQLDDISVGVNLARVMASKAIFDSLINGHVIGVNISNAGSNYLVDDILTLTPGTSLYSAQFVVTSVSAGAITGLAIRNAGVYSVLPNVTQVHATTSNSVAGTGATVTVSVEGQFNAGIGAGGSGYVVGEIVTVPGGSGGSLDPSFVVSAVSSGVVTALIPFQIGDRTTHVDTSGGAVATTSNLSGTGLTVTYTQRGWIQIASTYTDDLTDFEWWCRNTNESGDDCFCGMQTVFDASPYLELRVAGGYNALNTFDTQPNSWLDGGTIDRYIRVPTTGSDDFSLFMYQSGRVCNFIFSDDSSYELGIMGLFVPVTDTPATTFPQPYLCAGTVCSDDRDITDNFQGGVSSNANTHASLLHHGEASGAPRAPYRITNQLLQWSSAFDTNSDGYKLWPYFANPENFSNDLLAPAVGGNATIPSSPNGLTTTGINEQGSGTAGWFNEDSSISGTPGVAPIGSSGQLHFVAPGVIISDFSDGVKVHGTLEGLAYVHGRGLNNEDRVIDQNGRRWLQVGDTTSNELHRRILLLEG